MSAKHTPGPWRVYDRGIGFEVVTEDGETVNRGFRETFSEEDARLIAAAPDLLDVLREIDALWSGDGYVGPDTIRAKAHFTSRTINIWKALRAAIAKAEGILPANDQVTAGHSTAEANAK